MEAAVKIAKQRLSVLERIRCHAHIWGKLIESGSEGVQWRSLRSAGSDPSQPSSIQHIFN